MAPGIYVIHENSDWLPPFALAFSRRGIEFEDWDLNERAFELTRPPPQGVFYNRMSASSHTRGHRFSPELTSAVLAWLEGHGRRVINSSRALQLEVNKSAQLAALQACGIPVPRTIAAVGASKLVDATDVFAGDPVIVKPNRGGKGLGVKLIEDRRVMRELALEDALGSSVDGITLIQQYIRPADGLITRAEFIGGRFHYAARIDTSMGFELCPADVCVSEADPMGVSFVIVNDINAELKRRIELFLGINKIDIAGVEFSTDVHGVSYVYDVNTNTNYNAVAEAAAGCDAAQAVIDFLIAERNRIYDRMAA